MKSKLIALDIETAQPDGTAGDLALDPNRNIITQVAIWNGKNDSGIVSYETICKSFLQEFDIITHGGKFDFKTLISKGCDLTPEQYKHDTLAMAISFPHKVDDRWLRDYEARRQRLKKEGQTWHREAGKNSLKTLAPYFLGVDPFWENATHDDEEYALKDAEYTYKLAEFFLAEFDEDHRAFYERLMSWDRTLLQAELNGIAIDFKKLDEHEAHFTKVRQDSEISVRSLWATHLDQYAREQEHNINVKYVNLTNKALDKLNNPTETQEEKTKLRYSNLLTKALTKIKPFNLASPSQLKWLLQDRMQLDLTVRDKATGQDKDSVGKEVLERLKKDGVKGAKELLEYKTADKLCTAFFPSYRQKSFKGRIFTKYKLDGARTGRLSSNDPNMQQVSKTIQNIFCASKGKKLIYGDLSAIEPRLIAYLTECKALCDIFINGSDFHSFNVRSVLGIQEDDKTIKEKYGRERDLLKRVGLSLMYGAGWKRVKASSVELGFNWKDKFCKNVYYGFQETYADVWEYKAGLEDRIAKGEEITNIFGRSLTFEPGREYMQSLNTLIQSSGSDILLDGATKTVKACIERGIEMEPLLFIHDAFVAEAPKKQAQKAEILMNQYLTDYQLETKWGIIPLKSEGGLYDNLPVK